MEAADGSARAGRGGLGLGTRLVLAFAGVVALSLLLASLVAVVLLKGERERAARERLALSIVPVAAELRYLSQRGATGAELVAYVQETARQRNLRLLLVDGQGRVVVDTENRLEGQQLVTPERPNRRGRYVDYAAWTARPSGESRPLLFFTVFPSGSGAAVAGAAPFSLVMATPEADISQAWRGLLRGLFWAGLVAFLAATALALLIARSIARPLQTITAASEAMARGDYDRSVPETGSSEVRRLASAFNVMARHVSHSHALLRSFVANISHDLKTPLTSVLGFSQAMVDGAVTGPEEVREAGRIIHQEALRMDRLVDDLLFLSRMEAGQIPLMTGPVALNRLLRECAARLERALDGRSLALHLPDGALTVEGDADKLERTFANLLQNAVDHSDPGAAIEVRAEADGAEVRVAVHNTGSYIPPRDLARVFDRFHQVERSRSGRTRGHGLGLAIAREIVELHGGRIEVASDERLGTTFTVCLPVEGGRPAGRRPSAPAAGPAPAP